MLYYYCWFITPLPKIQKMIFSNCLKNKHAFIIVIQILVSLSHFCLYMHLESCGLQGRIWRLWPVCFLWRIWKVYISCHLKNNTSNMLVWTRVSSSCHSCPGLRKGTCSCLSRCGLFSYLFLSMPNSNELVDRLTAAKCYLPPEVFYLGRGLG